VRAPAYGTAAHWARSHPEAALLVDTDDPGPLAGAIARIAGDATCRHALARGRWRPANGSSATLRSSPSSVCVCAGHRRLRLSVTRSSRITSIDIPDARMMSRTTLKRLGLGRLAYLFVARPGGCGASVDRRRRAS